MIRHSATQTWLVRDYKCGPIREQCGETQSINTRPVVPGKRLEIEQRRAARWQPIQETLQTSLRGDGHTANYLERRQRESRMACKNENKGSTAE